MITVYTVPQTGRSIWLIFNANLHAVNFFDKFDANILNFTTETKFTNTLLQTDGQKSVDQFQV